MQSSLFVSAAALCFGLMILEGWILQRSHDEAAKALAALRQKKLERDSLVGKSPALSPENEEKVSSALTSARRALSEWAMNLEGDEAGGLAAHPPARSTDAFFELTDFIGQLRAKAEQAQVRLRPNECFGFSAYNNEGPPAKQIAAVHRQRLATQYVVGILLESHPQMILAVRRERPSADVVRDQRNRTDDYFEMDRALSLRQPGLIEGEAFRLEFTGQTETLRLFLNSLCNGRQAVLVREVEVEQFLPDVPLRDPVPASTWDGSIPLVKPGIMKFGVILELVRLSTSAATAS